MSALKAPVSGTAHEANGNAPKSPKKIDATFNPGDAGAVAIEAGTVIEVGDGDSDAGYGSDAATTASTSLASSVRDYNFENGRRYNKFREGTYQFPNDEAEQDREDMKHTMLFNLCGGKLHLAPVENPQQILDLGTGTGIWCIDMGDENPGASVLGVDLSPIQPQWVPPNVKFMVDDIHSPWLHGKERFDFVHARQMSTAIRNTGLVLSEAYQSMKPGGYIEFQDLILQPFCDDDSMREDYLVSKWMKLVTEGLLVLGVDMHASLKIGQAFEDAGFVNIQTRVLKSPIGTWPKMKSLRIAGAYQRAALYDGLEGMSLAAMTKGLKWNVEDVHLFLVDVRKELMDSRIHSYLKFAVVYAQKPVK